MIEDENKVVLSVSMMLDDGMGASIGLSEIKDDELKKELQKIGRRIKILKEKIETI